MKFVNYFDDSFPLTFDFFSELRSSVIAASNDSNIVDAPFSVKNFFGFASAKFGSLGLLLNSLCMAFCKFLIPSLI